MLSSAFLVTTEEGLTHLHRTSPYGFLHVSDARRIYSTEDMEPPQTHIGLWAGDALVV
ncbi:hypothetical protein IG631_01887 [Alternaria alternata]|jgi:hypothetical protein|nr:hypothetical protein IG631_01887 [Alternaria alternata]